MVSIRDAFKGVVMGCMVSSALGYRPGDQTCSYASGSTCPVASLALSPVDGSALIYPGGTTRCAFDDFQDASYSTNATFFFQVFPKKSSTKLLIFLQGGGACVDKYTCNFAVQCALGASSTFTTVARASSSGVFNRSDSGNLFNEWNIVHVPYCTGDLHVGARVLPAAETGLEAAFNRPQCLKQDKAMHMNGFENTKAAVQWARANFPDVSELVLGGASAGSLGAQALAAYVADAWGVTKQQQQQGASGRPRYAILADSYVGVLPDGATGSQVLNYYGACDADLKVPPAVAQGCKAETLQVSGLVSAMLQLLPQSDWLFLNSQGDRTQRYFYQLVKDGVFGFPFPNLLSEADFYARMTKILDVYTALSSRVSTFFVPGDRHVFLQGGAAAYYDTVTTGGQRLGAVLAQWLAQSGEPTTTAPPPAPPSPSPSVTPSPSPSSSPPPATAC